MADPFPPSEARERRIGAWISGVAHAGLIASVALHMVMTGLALAFGDTSGGFRKLIQIVFGLSIAFAASSFFLSFFSFSGGAVV
mgnify:CR=1 FL=1